MRHQAFQHERLARHLVLLIALGGCGFEDASLGDLMTDAGHEMAREDAAADAALDTFEAGLGDAADGDTDEVSSEAGPVQDAGLGALDASSPDSGVPDASTGEDDDDNDVDPRCALEPHEPWHCL